MHQLRAHCTMHTTTPDTHRCAPRGHVSTNTPHMDTHICSSTSGAVHVLARETEGRGAHDAHGLQAILGALRGACVSPWAPGAQGLQWLVISVSLLSHVPHTVQVVPKTWKLFIYVWAIRSSPLSFDVYISTHYQVK